VIGVDANILMELLEKRVHAVAVRSIIAQYQEAGEDLAISTLSLSHVFYLAESHKLTMRSVELLAFSYKMYDVVASDAAWALEHYAGTDFEDALQIAAAKRVGATTFLTLDAPLAKKYQKFLPIKLVR